MNEQEIKRLKAIIEQGSIPRVTPDIEAKAKALFEKYYQRRYCTNCYGDYITALRLLIAKWQEVEKK